MTHDEFTKKWLGRFVDYDGSYGAQCVDLMRQYCVEVFNISGYSLPRAGYAKDIYKNYNGSGLFEKINNTPTNAPQKGDIIFWTTYPPITGIAGHVAIVESADQNNLITFDQNYGSPLSCRFVKHSYKGVMGWCRVRGQKNSTEPAPIVEPTVAPPEPPQTPIIENPTVTTSETPTVTVTVNSTPEITPVNELPTQPDIVPVNIKTSLFLRFINWLLSLLPKSSK